MHVHTVLTIAGSDSSGGAGIQADLKTMTALGLYGMSVVTALTAQNTRGVRAVMEVTPQFLAEQMDAVFEDIFPDAVKVGMVANEALVCQVAESLKKWGARQVVVDPVMVATSGAPLLEPQACGALKEVLFPLATLLTPNIPEAEMLTGRVILSKTDMENAARQMGENYGLAVLVKGGHRVEDANDVLYDGGSVTWFEGKRILNPNTHGTGCTLSSAIASFLALGFEKAEAIARAKTYLEGALDSGLNLGSGSGPLDHGFAQRGGKGHGE